YQLLAGALVAMTPSLGNRVRRRALLSAPVAVLSLTGLVVASTDALVMRPVARGVLATVLTLALIVSLEQGGGPMRTILGSKPLVELGRISYGTYLCHWPVIVVGGRLGDFSPLQTLTIGV